MGGGGRTSSSKSTLYTIKTRYKIFGITIWRKITTQIHKPFTIRATIGDNDWTNIGKYVATNPNITQEIFALIKGLDRDSKNLVLRQISLSLKAYKSNESVITDITKQEIADILKERDEFFPNLFKLNDNLCAYDSYWLPTNAVTAEAFFYKYNLGILQPQTLAKIRNKDFIDAGGYIGDSAIMFEREFCDKNIYSFEATQTNFKLMELTLELNNSKRVIPINKGLGAEESTMQISIYGDGSSFCHSFGQRTETAHIITLDSFVQENNIEVGFIKVDIEGFEMKFLEGAKETIFAQKPAMVISIYHFGTDYFRIKPLIESWNLGYTFKITKAHSPHLTVGTTLFCEVVE